jgi:hypothetical protein
MGPGGASLPQAGRTQSFETVVATVPFLYTVAEADTQPEHTEKCSLADPQSLV